MLQNTSYSQQGLSNSFYSQEKVIKTLLTLTSIVFKLELKFFVFLVQLRLKIQQYQGILVFPGNYTFSYLNKKISLFK